MERITLIVNLNLGYSVKSYSDLYIVVKGIVTAVGQGADASVIAADKKDKQMIFENCALFIDCIT